jgi:hypothetical protein
LVIATTSPSPAVGHAGAALRGYAINPYNDYPPAPGAKPLGPFDELETSSLTLATRQKGEHSQATYHFEGLQRISTRSRNQFWALLSTTSQPLWSATPLNLTRCLQHDG